MANTVLLEARSYRPFKSSEEYLYAMREDLAEWLNTLYPDLRINVDNFMDRLDTGVVLCKHANNVRQAAEEYLIRRQARNKSMTKSMTSGLAGPILAMGNVYFLPAAKSGTFFARDNVSNFITWCRKSLQIFECLLFETDDLIMRKNEKHVILCLLEVARRGAKFGMLAPMLVQMERQIDREIAADIKTNSIDMSAQTDDGNQSNMIMSVAETMFDSDSDDEDDDVVQPMLVYGPQPQVVTNDLRSLDEMVRDLVEQCTCPSQFPMVRLSGGKYRIGDTKVLIFVRILRSHVMVRVGGGWDTLSHYLDKHDPCRCRSQHRSSTAARLVTRANQANNGIELHKAQVYYERSTMPKTKSVNFNTDSLKSPTNPVPSYAETKSQSPTHSQNSTACSSPQQKSDEQAASPISRRSLSPYPQLRNETKAKNRNSSGTNITAVINEIESMKWLEEDASSSANGPNSTSSNEIDSKYENASDNGSEISDEGYRSLGLTQQANKQTTSKTQSGPEDDDKTDAASNENTHCITPNNDSPTDQLHDDQHLRSDSTTPTALKKNSDLTDDALQKKSPSRIPRSPMARRRSIDSSSPSSANATPTTTGLPVFSRKMPVYRSVRKTVTTDGISNSARSTPIQNQIGKLGNGSQKLVQKPITSDDSTDMKSIGGTSSNNNQKIKTPFQPHSNQYRFTKSKNNTSPRKMSTSPLAQQILEVAESAQNDAQMLEKMKKLLSKYKNNNKSNDVDDLEYSPRRKPNKSPSFQSDNDESEFNSLDSQSNELTIARQQSSPLRKNRSNSVVSSRDNIACGNLIADRPVIRGTTRIPAPIRQNSELY